MSNVNRGPSASERVRASKIRTQIKAGATIDTEDAAWYADYEQAREQVAQARGASQTRKVKYEEEETQAVGTGDAAAAAAAGAMVREEGQRLDSILTVGIAALKEANQLLMSMTAGMMKRTEGFEATLIKMMQSQAALVDSHRENALRATDAEIRAMEAEKDAGEDGMSKLANELLPVLLERMGK